MSDQPKLPPLLEAVKAKVGNAGMLRLIAEFGGCEIAIPIKPRPWTVLASRCGMEVAKALADLRAGEKISIPNAAALRSKKVALLQHMGPRNQAARDTGATARYARMVDKRKPGELPLFPSDDDKDD